jgi:hypothetical protein
MKLTPPRRSVVAALQAARSVCLAAAFAATVTVGKAEAAETRTPYQSYINFTCPVGRTCALNFQAVPTNYRIAIDSVSCYVRGAGLDFSVDFVRLLVVRADRSIAAATALPTVPVGWLQTGRQTRAINERVSTFATAKQHFQIYGRIGSGALQGLECSLSGEKVKLS